MINYSFVIAVDPGGDGAVAILDQCGNAKAYKFKTQRNELIWALRTYLPGAFVIIEDVHAIHGAAAKVTFAFGRNLGHIEGIIETLGGTIHARVISYDWQAAVTRRVLRPFTRHLDGKEKRKLLQKHRTNLKQESIRAASVAYPDVVKNHDGVADAVNIGRYGILVLQGKIQMATKKPAMKKKVASTTKKVASKKPAAKKPMAPTAGY